MGEETDKEEFDTSFLDDPVQMGEIEDIYWEGNDEESITITVRTEDDEMEMEVKPSALITCILGRLLKDGDLTMGGEELDKEATFDENNIETGAIIRFAEYVDETVRRFDVGKYQVVQWDYSWMELGDTKHYVVIEKRTKCFVSGYYYAVDQENGRQTSYRRFKTKIRDYDNTDGTPEEYLKDFYNGYSSNYFKASNMVIVK